MLCSPVPAGYEYLSSFADLILVLTERAQGRMLQAVLQRALATGHIKPLPAIYLPMLGDCLQIATAVEEPPSAFKPEPLTDKEREILALLESGASNKEVSRRTNITLATAKWHLKNIYAKLAVSNRTEAVSRARQHQLL